ncbi:MAG: YdjY domain-containing protein [Planctomycetota bacterium]
MRGPTLLLTTLLAILSWTGPTLADEGRLVSVDAEAREVRVKAEVLRVDMPLEFVCVVTGTADHESLLRTRAQPSTVHAALLGVGMRPGRPLRYSEAARRWLAPVGPPMRAEIEWEVEGETRRVRVGEWIRHIETREPMPPQTFVFVGSRLYETNDGGQAYAADATGQLVALVNFESTVIDVDELASSDNATLQWETNVDVVPPAGTPVTLILSPVAGGTPATRPAVEAPPAAARLEQLRADWERAVLPRAEELRDAAQAHYDLMQAYQDEINRLIDQADELRREMDLLQQRFDDLTTPQPAAID